MRKDCLLQFQRVSKSSHLLFQRQKDTTGTILIIDSHAHYWKYFPGLSSPDIVHIIAQIEMSEISLICISSLSALVTTECAKHNKEIYEICTEFPHHVRGLAVVNPYSGKSAVQELENCLSRYNFCGLKLHPWLQGYSAASDMLTPLIEVCQSYDVPIYFHSGSTPYAQVYQIARHIKNNKKVRFILGHMGERYQWQDALQVARKYDNAFLETSANMYSFAIERAVRNIGADRILFGTDIPFHSPGIELLKICRLNIADEEKEWILSRTASAVFGRHVFG